MSHDDPSTELRTGLRNHFRKVCKEQGQATVAKAIGYNPSTISQLLSGTYPADDSAVMEKFREIYGGITVDCPILSTISLDKCAFHRRREFAASNPVRVALFRSCPSCNVWKGGN